MKIPRKRRLLITLLVIIAVVLLFVVWIVWPEKPKDLTLHLKSVRSELVRGTNKFLFKVEGAEKYDVYVIGFRYVRGEALPLSQDTFYSLDYSPRRASQFYADHPQYSLFNYEGCRLQADVSILAHESKLSQLRSVITDTWKSRKQFGLTFSSAKLFWQLHPPQLIISEQILTSEPLTNIPPL